MDKLQAIKEPIVAEFEEFKTLFFASLQSENPLLNEVLTHIKQRTGKMLRPILTLLIAKGLGNVSNAAYHGAIALELLHNASLLHDDVVDESDERRGQPSVNAIYGNKVSVLAGDYIMAHSLNHSALTNSTQIVQIIAGLGDNLATGEIVQLANVDSNSYDESIYFEVIRKKTAALFSSCAAVGAISAGAGKEMIKQAYNFGDLVGIAFQIKDDIFDYYSSLSIGKPTGNDMREGKLTLPSLYVLNTLKDEALINIARRIRSFQASDSEIAHFIEAVKKNGGIEYAEKVMREYRDKAMKMIESLVPASIRDAIACYIDFVIERDK